MLDPSLVASLQQVSPGATVMFELVASPLPADDASRAALAQYATALAASVKHVDSIVLAPAPTPSSAPGYVAAFSAIRVGLPDTRLGVALDGATDPGGTATALAGIGANVVAYRPAPAVARGTWTLADLTRVRDAFPDAAVVIDGAPAPFGTSIKSAACTPSVTAVVLDRLSEALRPTLRSAAATAERGAFVCPGSTFDAQPFNLEFFDTLTPPPIFVPFDCNRDCLYLVTLDDARGRPVVAKRGQLVGGVHSAGVTLALPRASLPPGTYRIDVRLVARVNPGKVTRFLGPPLAR